MLKGVALNDGLYIMVVCRECHQPLTHEEVEYLETRCKRCEWEWLNAIEEWRHGGENKELDALYSEPQPVLH